MKKNLVVYLLIFSLSFNLHASIFGEENVTLGAILTEEILQTADIATQVQQLYHMIESINKTVEIAKATKALYEEAKNYTKEELLKNSLQGFCEGFGNNTDVKCGQITGAYTELKQNAEYVLEGDNKFWADRGYWKNKSDDFMKRLVKGFNRTYIFHKVAPEASKAKGFEKHDKAQDIIMAALTRSGLYNTMRMDNFGDANIMEQVKIYAEDVAKSKNLVGRGLSTIQAQMGTLMKNTTRMKNAAEKKILDNEKDAYLDKKKTEYFMQVYNEVSKEAGKSGVDKSDD